jgi:hypothetical protein
VAALYAFLVEGVLTTVLYEAGLFDLVMPAYFIGWHGLFSVMFGWYALRLWLLQGQWRHVLIYGSGFGLFWGTWSITWWLPEAFEGSAHPEPWSVVEFGLYAVIFTATLALSHWVLGRGVWPRKFKPSTSGKWLVGLVLAVLFGLTVIPIFPAAVVKLIVLLGILFLGLHAGRGRQKHETDRTIFSELAGGVKGVHVLALFVMPLVATAVYALATTRQPSKSEIRILLEGIPIVQGGVGASVFLWALVTELRALFIHTGGQH